MIDISGLGVQFRGYPVTLLSEGAAQAIGTGHWAQDDLTAALLRALRAARDTAEPGEPSGWIFEADLDGTAVWVERFGGMRSQDSHEGGQWSVYLPAER